MTLLLWLLRLLSSPTTRCGVEGGGSGSGRRDGGVPVVEVVVVIQALDQVVARVAGKSQLVASFGRGGHEGSRRHGPEGSWRAQTERHRGLERGEGRGGPPRLVVVEDANAGAEGVGRGGGGEQEAYSWEGGGDDDERGL